MDKYVIELDGVTVRKGRNLLLKDVTLGIGGDEFVGIIGPNGAGKSTLLNVIAGFEKFEGTLRLFGESEPGGRSRKTRLRIGYVPQFFRIDPTFPMRALDAVMTGATGRLGLFRSPGARVRERAVELMEMMRVGHLAKRPLGHLSGGELQKVSLARVILQEPRVLLLDEPTANLDMAVQKEVLDLISEIHRREKVAVLFVTHDFTMIPDAMKRAVLLSQGKVVFDGDTDTALSGETLSSLFHYSLETFQRNGRRFVSYG